jgi:hypothetical protein
MNGLDISFRIDVPYAEDEALNRIRAAFTRRDPLEDLGMSMRGPGYYRYYRSRQDELWVQWHLTEGLVIRMDIDIAVAPQGKGSRVAGKAYLKTPTVPGVIFSCALAAGIFYLMSGFALMVMAPVGALLFVLLFLYQSSKLVQRLRRVLLKT